MLYTVALLGLAWCHTVQLQQKETLDSSLHSHNRNKWSQYNDKSEVFLFFSLDAVCVDTLGPL